MDSRGKAKQVIGVSSEKPCGKGQAVKAQNDEGKNGKNTCKPKRTLDEKAKAGVEGGFLNEEECKAYMAKERCFFCT